MDETKIVGDAMAFQISGCNSTGREERYLHIGHSYTSQHPTLWAQTRRSLRDASMSTKRDEVTIRGLSQLGSNSIYPIMRLRSANARPV
jgi:hypothetical protein